MKKLLSILGAITLVGTVTPNVISCHNKKVVNNDDAGTAKNLEVLNEIQTKAGWVKINWTTIM
ncbi:lipoprotein [Spiroplasma endosymbiont of Glossina fuscipes fuscipes]|uniref:lipoprotein n=1 Tax=Spiroplasma endosymbiont of Glossina fuscipes fuscipes TaxID=2004463 RepID=UPI003C7150B8